MDQSEDAGELERKIEQATRIASRINDQTTVERLRAWIQDLRQRRQQRLEARRIKQAVSACAKEIWEQSGRPSDRDVEFCRGSNLNFLFRLSLNFYRLVSSSVARGSIPNDQRPVRRPLGFHGLAEIKQWNRSRTGNCGKEPSGDRPDGSCYCWHALARMRGRALDPSKRLNFASRSPASA